MLFGTLIVKRTSINWSHAVPRLACKICTKDWSASYSDHQYILSLQTTRDCRIFHKLCTRFKIVNNTFSFPENIIELRTRLKTHALHVHPSCSTNSLYIPYAHTNSFMYSFIPNTTSLWNGLPITSLSSFGSFKKYLFTKNCFQC